MVSEFTKMCKINNVSHECFVVLEGEEGGNDILIPLNSLTNVHYAILNKIAARAAKRNSDMLDVMKDTTLENGSNALVFFKGLFRVVPKPVKRVVEEKAPRRRRKAKVEDADMIIE